MKIKLLWQVPILFFLLFCVVSAMWPLTNRSYLNRERALCQTNLKDIAMAHFHYSQDYDERMPLVAVHDAAISPQRPLGWADALQPYLKSTALFQCPSQADTETSLLPHQNGYTDYWYNAQLAGVDHKSLSKPMLVLLCGDGNDSTDATNARYSLSELPATWRKADAPSLRHMDGADYAFADGHVKWIMVRAFTASKVYTFDLQ